MVTQQINHPLNQQTIVVTVTPYCCFEQRRVSLETFAGVLKSFGDLPLSLMNHQLDMSVDLIFAHCGHGIFNWLGLNRSESYNPAIRETVLCCRLCDAHRCASAYQSEVGDSDCRPRHTSGWISNSFLDLQTTIFKCFHKHSNVCYYRKYSRDWYQKFQKLFERSHSFALGFGSSLWMEAFVGTALAFAGFWTQNFQFYFRKLKALLWWGFWQVKFYIDNPSLNSKECCHCLFYYSQFCSNLLTLPVSSPEPLAYWACTAPVIQAACVWVCGQLSFWLVRHWPNLTSYPIPS